MFEYPDDDRTGVLNISASPFCFFFNWFTNVTWSKFIFPQKRIVYYPSDL